MADEWTEVPAPAADDWTEVTPTAQTSSPSTTRVKQLPFTPAQQKQYHALLKSPDTTPEVLSAWGEEQGFGPATNAKEVVDYYKKYKDSPLPVYYNQVEPGVGVNAAPATDDWTEVPANAPAPKPDLGEPGLIEGLAYKVADYLNEKGGDSSEWTLSDENRRLLGADRGGILAPLMDLPANVGSLGVGAMRGLGMGADIATDLLDAPLKMAGVERNVNNILTRPGEAIDELLTNPMLGMETGVPHMGANPIDDLPAIADNIGKQAAFEEAVAAATAAPYKSPRGKNQLKVHTKVLQDEADRVSASWKGGPEYKVVDTIDDIPDEKLRNEINNHPKPKDVEAVITPDGKVHIIAKHIKDPSRIAAIVYHEGLGHHGMSKQFGKKLDDVLRAFYDTNPEFAAQTDAWRKRNKGQYGGDTARAADEVLAGISEGGVLPPPALMDKIKNTIKNAARKAGMKNVNYSNREIMSILAEAHSRVVNGSPTIDYGVTRFITAWHGTPADKFDNADAENPHGKFDDSKMSSGEGAQAFGWGHYVAEDKNIAKRRYRDGLLKRQSDYSEEYTVDNDVGVPQTLSLTETIDYVDNFADDFVDNFGANKGDSRRTSNALLQYFRDEHKFPTHSEMQNFLDDSYGKGHVVKILDKSDYDKMVKELTSKGFRANPKGSLFQVYLPDDKHWFSWYKPIEGEAKAAFEKLGVTSEKPFKNQHFLDAYKEDLRALKNKIEVAEDNLKVNPDSAYWEQRKELAERHIEDIEPLIAKYEQDKAEWGKSPNRFNSGEQMYYALANKIAKEQGITGWKAGEKEASKALAKEGIPGHKFLDSGGTGQGKGSHNYVIYDPDTSGVKIEARFSTKQPANEKGRPAANDAGRPNEPTKADRDWATKELVYKRGYDPRLIDELLDTDISHVPKELWGPKSRNWSIEHIEDMLTRINNGEKVTVEKEAKKHDEKEAFDKWAKLEDAYHGIRQPADDATQKELNLFFKGHDAAADAMRRAQADYYRVIGDEKGAIEAELNIHKRTDEEQARINKARSGSANDDFEDSWTHDWSEGDPDVRFSTKKSLTPEKMETKNDVDELIELAAAKAPKGARVSQKETTKRAEELGLTTNAYLNAADQEGLAAQIHGAHQVLTTAMDEVAGLGERAQTEGLTPALRSEIGQKLATAMAVYAKFDKNTAEIGRALNILKVAARSKDFAKDIAKFSSDGGLAALLSDDETLMRFLNTQRAVRQTGGSAAAAKFFKLQSKALPEDYAKTLIFNSMLSSPITWGKNAVGSPLNFTMDLIADTAGAVIGKIPGMAPGASGRELAARLYGPLAAFKNWETYKNVGKALKEGKNTRSKPFYEHRNDIFTGKASQFLKTPSHILAGVDELWANMFHASNVRGLAVSEAIKTGKKGDDLKAEIERLTNNPTDAMLKEADKVTNRQVFRGDPSKMVEWIKDHSTPVVLDQTEIRLVQDPTTGKMVPMGKTVRKADGTLGRAGKFAMSLAVPFAPTLEQIGKAIVKNSGPLGLFSKELRADLMTPGPKRNSALGRIAVSSAFMYWIGTKAADGEVSGIGNPDYQQQKEEQATKPPMSIKMGDEWVSYAGLDPIAGMIAAVSTAVERSQAKDEPLPAEIGWAFISGMAESLLKSTYADSVANLINMAGEGVKVARGQETPKTGIENFLGGQVANITNPAFVRWYTQKAELWGQELAGGDKKQRDISGDGTLMSGVAGRAMAGVPWVSQTLPVKHDVYGREITNARQDKYVEKDPAILELARLSKLLPDKALISEVKRSDLEKLPKPILSKDLQRYQKKSGEYIVETVRQMQQSGEWDKMTDAEKLKEVLAIKKDMRANAREELFPKYYGPDAEETWTEAE